MKTTRLAALLGLGSLPLAVNIAMAQTVPPDAGALLNQQQQQDRPQTRPQNDVPLVDTPPPVARGEAGFRARIDRVRFSGAEGLLDDATLQAAVAGALGRSLNFAQLQALAQRVSATLQAHGYLLALASFGSDGSAAIDVAIAVAKPVPDEYYLVLLTTTVGQSVRRSIVLVDAQAETG